jgi:hypothetical protein
MADNTEIMPEEIIEINEAEAVTEAVKSAEAVPSGMISLLPLYIF